MQEIEMNDKMIERRDKMDNATYQLYQVLLGATEEEMEKLYPWDIADIEMLQGYAIAILGRKGLFVCNPYVCTNGDIQYRCTLSECNCKECRCQDHFMDKERILSGISDFIKRDGLEIMEVTEDAMIIHDKVINNDFRISIENYSKAG